MMSIHKVTHDGMSNNILDNSARVHRNVWCFWETLVKLKLMSDAGNLMSTGNYYKLMGYSRRLEKYYVPVHT